MKPFISIIITTLNEEKYIEDTLKALRNQYYEGKYETIVVDGMSKDNTVKIAKKYANEVVVNKTNIPEGRNLGVKHGKGDIFIFLDADTVVPPNFLKRVMNIFSSKNVDSIICYPKPQEPNWFCKLLFFLIWILIRLGLSNPCFACLIVKKQVFNELDGFDERFFYNEDLDLLRRLRVRHRVVLPLNLITFPSARRWTKSRLFGLTEIFMCVVRAVHYYVFHKCFGEYKFYH